MLSTPSQSLLCCFQHMSDPRHRRGIRHPFPSLMAAMLLGLICRQPDFASIARWTRHHWGILREALGFTQSYPPHATTFERVAERFSVAEFRAALATWLSRILGDSELVAAVDGKTSKQALNAQGDPLHCVNVFAHEARLVLADWPVGEGQGTEADVLREHLDELLTAFPSLRVLTGDAAYCQRPLARAIVEAGRDYVLAIKENQPDLLEVAQTTFSGPARPADALAREKNEARS